MQRGLTDVIGEKDNKEWSHEIIDALYIATSRVTHRPNEQYTLETLKMKNEYFFWQSYGCELADLLDHLLLE